MTDPETLIGVIERWRTRGQDADDCANDESGWYDCGIINPPPTHWMALPQPPQQEQP